MLLNIWCRVHAESNVPATSIIAKENNASISSKGKDLACSNKRNNRNVLWEFEPVDGAYCVIRNRQTNRVLEAVEGNGDDYYVHIAKENKNHVNQLWYVQLCEEGTYRIRLRENDYCLGYRENGKGKLDFYLGEAQEQESQTWYIDEKVYRYANQYLYELEESDPELLSAEENVECEKLNKERATLCVDYEKNKERIEEIDKRLEEIGVTEIDDAEVTEKYRTAENTDIPSKARVAVLPKKKGVKWTSRKVVNCYRGKTMELQILEAKPYKADSDLNSTTAAYEASSGGFKAGAKNVAMMIAKKVAGLAPEIGGDISKGITVYNYAKAFCSGLKTTTVVSKIKSSYFVVQSAEMREIFVKYQGASDNTQILAYRGNKTVTKTQVTTPVFSYNGQNPDIKNKQYKANYASPYYSSGYCDYACEAYYNYKNNKPEKAWDLLVTGFNLELVNGKKKSIPVPICECY